MLHPRSSSTRSFTAANRKASQQVFPSPKKRRHPSKLRREEQSDPERICIPRGETAPPPPAKPLPSSGRFRLDNANRESPPLRGIRSCSSNPMRRSRPLRRKLCRQASWRLIRQAQACTGTCEPNASESGPRIHRARSSCSRPKSDRAFPNESSTRTEDRATRAKPSYGGRYRRS